MIWFETSCVQYNRWPMCFLIFPHPLSKWRLREEGLLFIFPPIIFLFSTTDHSYFRPIMVETLALGIYAFYHTPELFKCEALLAMPENAYYQKVSSYRLLNGKDMIICRDQIYFMILAFKKIKSAT